MPAVFVIASLLLGDPKLTLEDTVFENPMACQFFLHHQYDAATIEVFNSTVLRSRGPASKHRFVPRPLVQHPHALAYGQLDARPGPNGLLEHATHLVEVVAGVQPASSSGSTSLPCRSCGGQHRADRESPRGRCC